MDIDGIFLAQKDLLAKATGFEPNFKYADPWHYTFRSTDIKLEFMEGLWQKIWVCSMSMLKKCFVHSLIPDKEHSKPESHGDELLLRSATANYSQASRSGLSLSSCFRQCRRVPPWLLDQIRLFQRCKISLFERLPEIY